MKFDLSQKWTIALLTVILPSLLLIASVLLDSGICVFMAIMFWVGLVLIMVFIPYYKETA